MSTFQQRLSDFIISTGLSASGFNKKVGLSNGFLSKVTAGKSSISVQKLEKIFYHYPDLNLNWLFKGEGEIWLTSKEGANQPGDSELRAEFEALKKQVKALEEKVN